MSEIREQAMLMGARAAEAVREGWLPDSIQRSDEDLTALILELRRSNQDERRRLLAAREAVEHVVQGTAPTTTTTAPWLGAPAFGCGGLPCRRRLADPYSPTQLPEHGPYPTPPKTETLLVCASSSW